jgi:hypothetical protein
MFAIVSLLSPTPAGSVGEVCANRLRAVKPFAEKYILPTLLTECSAQSL